MLPRSYFLAVALTASHATAFFFAPLAAAPPNSYNTGYASAPPQEPPTPPPPAQPYATAPPSTCSCAPAFPTLPTLPPFEFPTLPPFKPIEWPTLPPLQPLPTLPPFELPTLAPFHAVGGYATAPPASYAQPQAPASYAQPKAPASYAQPQAPPTAAPYVQPEALPANAYATPSYPTNPWSSAVNVNAGGPFSSFFGSSLREAAPVRPPLPPPSIQPAPRVIGNGIIEGPPVSSAAASISTSQEFAAAGGNGVFIDPAPSPRSFNSGAIESRRGAIEVPKPTQETRPIEGELVVSPDTSVSPSPSFSNSVDAIAENYHN